MQNTTEKSSRSAEGLYKFFIYFVLVLLAVTIIVPVAWVFMASIKQNAEFYGNPWALPAGFYWQNFVNAWNGAKMGEYMLNSVIVTALAWHCCWSLPCPPPTACPASTSRGARY